MMSLATLNYGDALDRYDDIADALFWLSHMAAVSDVEGPHVSAVLRPIISEFQELNDVFRKRFGDHNLSTKLSN